MGFATIKLWITSFFFQSYIRLSDYYFIFFSVHPGQLHPGQLPWYQINLNKIKNGKAMR